MTRLDDDGERQARVEIGLRGRTWVELEADILAAMCQETAVRRACVGRLRAVDFSTARHRAIFQALTWTGDRMVTDEGLAAAIGARPSAVTAWRLRASPSEPYTDIDLFAAGLAERRGGD